MAPIGWGILGCARISRSGLIPGIRKSRLGRLVALAGSDWEKTQSWANEFQIPSAYESYEQLLADPNVQVVYIPARNHLHKRWTTAAAAAKKHVLCEKPLAVSASEAEEMSRACQRNGVLLMEGFMWRHHPRTQLITRFLQEGKLGSLRMLRYSFAVPIASDPWRLDPRQGGGALLDLGCYGVNTARFLAHEEPEAVHAVARFGPTGVDTILAATLQFPSLIAQIDCSFALAFRYRVEIIGTEGMLLLDRASLSGPPIRLRAVQRSEVREVSIPGGDQFARMVDHFSECVQRGTLTGVAENGVLNMHAVDRVAAAMRS